MATIETRIGKDGTKQFRVKVRLRGHLPASATFDRITDAKRWAAETETRIRQGRYFSQAEARKHTLADLVDRYIAQTLPHADVKNKRERALLLYRWRERLGHVTLANLTSSMITEARSKMLGRITRLGKPVSPASINRETMALSSLLSTAVKDYEWMEDSPMRKLNQKQLAEPKGRVRILDERERDALLRECKAHSHALYVVVVAALCTGARRGELLNLRWPEVDMQRGLMTFLETKNKEIRTVPIVGALHALLAEHRKIRRLDTDLVFPGETSKPLEIGKMFREACQRAVIKDFRFHDLRHTAASWIAMNGGTLAEIAEVLGHKTLQMVKRYAHLTEGHTRGVLERMSKAKLSD